MRERWYPIGVKRAAFMFNPEAALASTYVPSLETAARSLKVAPIIPHVPSIRFAPLKISYEICLDRHFLEF
jgi:hypothetical protein